MNQQQPADLESDPRFPSGPWTGYFLQRAMPGRHMMDIQLTFRNGVLKGEGRDWVGSFIMTGRYSLEDGKCHWTKRYLGKHDVYYQGYNEGKGIWGVWEINITHFGFVDRGGFHIWPEGMALAEDSSLTAEADLPSVVEDRLEPDEVLVSPLK